MSDRSVRSIDFMVFLISGIAGYGIMLYGLRRIVEHWDVVDGTSMSGDIEAIGLRLLLLGILLVGVSFLFFLSSTKQDASTEKQLRDFTTLSLVFAGISVFVTPLVIATIILGIKALFVSCRPENRTFNFVVRYRVAVVFALIAPIVSAILSFV